MSFAFCPLFLVKGKFSEYIYVKYLYDNSFIGSSSDLVKLLTVSKANWFIRLTFNHVLTAALKGRQNNDHKLHGVPHEPPNLGHSIT